MNTLKIFLLITAISTIGYSQNVKVGDIAPDLVLENPQGEQIKLSDLRGKMVLIDFWASWCRPCRKENPVLVKAYNNFKDANFIEGKGFTIYSISIDSRKHSWIEAIEKDKLVWPYHVSDLKGWRSIAAKKYGIRSVPSNFLINGEGKVIAVSLRGERLEDVLNNHRKTWFKKVFE